MTRLVIHHHAVVYVAPTGELWMPSFIARWVDALADYIDEIGLLLHESKQRVSRQDDFVLRPNVHLISLGPPGHRWDHFERIQRIKRICRDTTKPEDILLIRGITPRQGVVWKSVRSERKAFLLVGEPVPKPFSSVKSVGSIGSLIVSHYRIHQLRYIFLSGKTFVNAPNLVNIVDQKFGVIAKFVPTNTIRANEFVSEGFLQEKKLSHPIRLLFCGRVTITKGIIETLQAVSGLIQSRFLLHLDVVGSEGEGHSLSEFQTVADQLSITEFVEWHGHIPYGEALLRFFKEADILLLPSYSEGFPHVLWEAAANGCLVIASKVGGIPSLWEENKHLIFVEPKNSLELKNAIVRLLESPSLRLSLAKTAYDHAKNFTVEACARELSNYLVNDPVFLARANE